jgi:short-subunit dehydrogenase
MATAWITGASGAWGGALARELLESGYDLVALGRRDVPACVRLAGTLGRQWESRLCDLGERDHDLPSGCPDLFIHAAVSHAGSREELARANYLAPTELVEEVARRMLERGRGNIAVLLPQNARLGLAGLGDFAAPQAALWTWCEARRDELAREAGQVTLTVVIPPRTASATQRFVSQRSGHQARLSRPDARGLLRAILAGKRRAGRRPVLAAVAMLVR